MRKPIISEKVQKFEIWRIFLGTNDLNLYHTSLGFLVSAFGGHSSDGPVVKCNKINYYILLDNSFYKSIYSDPYFTNKIKIFI